MDRHGAERQTEADRDKQAQKQTRGGETDRQVGQTKRMIDVQGYYRVFIAQNQ